MFGKRLNDCMNLQDHKNLEKYVVFREKQYFNGFDTL